MKKVICNEEIPVSEKSENTNVLPIDDKDDTRYYIKDEDIDMKVPTNNQEKQYTNSQVHEEKEEKIEIIDNTQGNNDGQQQ